MYMCMYMHEPAFTKSAGGGDGGVGGSGVGGGDGGGDSYALQADFQKARSNLVLAAKGGHIVARAICRKEGWGRFRKDRLPKKLYTNMRNFQHSPLGKYSRSVTHG